MQRTLILNTVQSQQKIERIAAEIQEKLFGTDAIFFLGIGEKGEALAKHIIKELPKKIKVESATCDKARIPADGFLPNVNFEGKTVIVLDDVLESGTTLMHVCSAVMLQNPKQIKTMILVDRMHPRFPINADFVGLTLSTTLHNHVEVLFEKKGISAYLN
jgi:pyrimidine operon attenuation protein/uracil phosphoribosyltransferase